MEETIKGMLSNQHLFYGIYTGKQLGLFEGIGVRVDIEGDSIFLTPMPMAEGLFPVRSATHFRGGFFGDARMAKAIPNQLGIRYAGRAVPLYLELAGDGRWEARMEAWDDEQFTTKNENEENL